MPLDLPDDAVEIAQRAKTDVRREAPSSDPFLRNNWLSALIVGYANRIFDFYLQLKEAIKVAFPDTAYDEYLDRWAGIFGITRLPATVARGNVTATGTPFTVIPSGTVLADSDGNLYTSGSAFILPYSFSADSITRVGSVATVTIPSDFDAGSNILVTITGANEPEYNVTDAAIQVTGLRTFTYTVSGTPTTPATGTILVTGAAGTLAVVSDETGADKNKDADTPLTLQSPIAGIDNEMWVSFTTIDGGFDQESDADQRLRLLYRIQNPVAHFNVSAITSKAQEVPGVTRVFVQPVTPVEGQVSIYFMRDNDVAPIPTSAEIADVKAKVDELLPANTDTTDVFVLAPTAVTVDFTFSALTPDTSTMRDAIEANLQQFFAERTEFETDVDQDAYRAAIFNTVDTVTGDEMSTFTLSTPTGDVTVTTGEIGILGNVTFS